VTPNVTKGSDCIEWYGFVGLEKPCFSVGQNAFPSWALTEGSSEHGKFKND